LKWGLASLRFILVASIAFLLLNPLIRSVSRHSEKPIIIFAQDNSASLVASVDSAYYKGAYLDNLQKLKEELSNKYEVAGYVFGETARTGNEVD